tara:strand:+ start:736 stop:1791 length:1056 start_codon:yes stop_codon:yes gene_type:complete
MPNSLEQLKYSDNSQIGYEKFLAALYSSQVLSGEYINIELPSSKSVQSKPYVLRLDGMFFYKFTLRNLLNYIYLTRGVGRSIESEKRFFLLNTGLSNFGNRWLNRHIWRKARGANGLIFQSQLSKKMFQMFGPQVAIPSTIIPNGVSLTEYAPDFRIKRSENKIEIAITANFRPHKRLVDAIKISVALEKSTGKKVYLNVAGKVDKITRRAADGLLTDQVQFLGTLSKSDLIGLYSKCHIGIAPAIFDPCPNSVIEMMACGLPVITCSNSGAAELVPNDQFIVDEYLDLKFLEFQSVPGLPKCSVDAWVTKIEGVLAEIDCHRKLTLDHCRSFFDIEDIALQYKKFYYDVC